MSSHRRIIGDIGAFDSGDFRWHHDLKSFLSSMLCNHLLQVISCAEQPVGDISCRWLMVWRWYMPRPSMPPSPAQSGRGWASGRGAASEAARLATNHEAGGCCGRMYHFITFLEHAGHEQLGGNSLLASAPRSCK